ncbi:MAG: chromosome segregation protein SMC, partial [Burkholderiaceae bacterium]|nr:chromosome segregation protein SMC [Burkholderiaceae bacterium]
FVSFIDTSVELNPLVHSSLIFDNADGRAQGQWSSFAELSVKRVLTRDGNSSYYINNQVVRRKDVQDIFLGTGLGPRAYAIIGQGTISRILESKPEELRVFLEEAAGVSKYKERRKETAARLEDTQENLVRVQDILRELEQQLARLEAQAQVASRHNELQTQMKAQQQLLWFVKQTESGKEQEKHANSIRETQVKLEEETAKLRHAEAELETMRTEQYALQDVVSKAQGDLYETNAEINQVEAEIKYVQESRQRLHDQVADLQAQLDRWTTQEKEAAQAQRQAEQEFRAASENEAKLQAEFCDLQAQSPSQDERFQLATQALDEARSALASLEQRLVSLQERIHAGAVQFEDATARATRLQDELATMRKPDEEALQMATDRHIMAQRKADEAKAKASQNQEHVPATDAKRQSALDQLQKANQDVQQSEAKLSALTALQASVQAQGKIGPWLESKGLKESKRLWQELKVEKGWEPALESVLRERLAALTGKSLNETLSLAKEAPPSRLAILLTDDLESGDIKAPSGFVPFLSRVQASGVISNVLQEWLSNIYIADTLQAKEQYSTRAAQIDSELSEINQQLKSISEAKTQTEGQLHDANAQKATLESQLATAQNGLEQASASREQLRLAVRQAEMTAQEAAFNTRSLQQRINDLQRDQSTARTQIMELQDRFDANQNELKTLSDEAAQNKLQSLLVTRSEREAALAKARTEQEAMQHQLRQADEARLMLEQTLQPMRDRVVDLQLREQAARLSYEQFTTLLNDDEADFQALAERYSPDLRASSLQGEVTRLNNEIQSLGPVNMAALEELSSSRERKSFLDAQSADLNEAIQTLTDAIAKIDAETRDLLQGTFDQVNTHFGRLFPELFGGGHAQLVMTGEEILDAGVQVMAQPPGKKNSTIHLLSGGEKALTAIALVFSLFLLNPAPFCLLDEVDAPLDDANTMRYSEMVSRMSDKTQFVFISHNKITMEIASQLIGVTMQEQGVSRIVAVDIASAVSMVEAA